MLDIDLSWPGLSRPSTTFFFLRQDVDARHKAGHDDQAELPSSSESPYRN
jgi:hypothetical protein